MKTSKFLILGMLAASLVMVAAPRPAGAVVVDLTTDASGVGSATINGAIWQIFNTADPTGSGVFYSFLRVQQTPTERGYNTDGRPLQFDENTSATFTHKFYLKDVPQVEIGGVIYREFQLDINEKNSNPDWYISLDEFQVWTTNDANLLGYIEGSHAFTSGAQLVYDLDVGPDGDSWIKMDYRANNGSGKRDYRVFVPESDFDGKRLTYVVLFTRHGAQGGDWVSDSGFEEWGVAQYPAQKAGYKFNDLNANGVWDEGEPGLNGWTINLVGENIDDKGHGHPVSMSTVTADDADGHPGYYSFTVLPGNYTVSEVLQAGWAQTFPGGPGTWVVTLGNGELDLDNNFGNVQYTPDISITKSANVLYFCLSEAPKAVTYTYLVKNTGNEDLQGVVVTDDTCSSVSGPSGDNGDGYLNPDETWTYTCSTSLSDTTTNIAGVVAYGRFSGTEVTDSDSVTVDAFDVDVYVTPSLYSICAGGEKQFCAVPSLGSGYYSYSWTKTGDPTVIGTDACITVSEAGEYCVTVTDTETGCKDSACATLTIVTPPTCSITGPASICDTDTEVMFCSQYSADSYLWEISGDGEIVLDDGDCVYVNPTGPGSFTLTLTVCNDSDAGPCCNECEKEVTVNPCQPGILVEKYPDIDDFCLGEDPQPVTYTYYVTTGTGDEPLDNVELSDDTCGSPTYVSGDDNVNGWLDPTEEWIYTCSTDLYDTTTNTVDAVGYGVYTGNEVTSQASATVYAHDVSVEVTPASASICAGSQKEFCATPSLGSGNYSYFWYKDAVLMESETGNCITVSDAATYCVVVLDNDTGCYDTACGTLTVVTPPDCSISGPTLLCDGEDGQYCASVSDADSYEWSISGNGTITSAINEQCVTVHAGAPGTFTLTLSICYDSDEGPCCNECPFEVTVESCGNTFCGYTQGFWGNEGGKACDPSVTTTDLLIVLLDALDASSPGSNPVVVGILGERSITFDTADCILLRLPAGGTPKALPPTLGDAFCDSLPPSLVKKNTPEIDNVLVGQAVALTLNLRLYPGCLGDGSDLSTYVLSAGPLCTVPYGSETPCPQQVTIPASLDGLSVGDLLEEANKALAGQATSASIGDINKAVDAINRAFDGCRTVVSCPVEICDNGIDDDCDGLIDAADPDCQI